MCQRYLSHSSTVIWPARVGPFCHLRWTGVLWGSPLNSLIGKFLTCPGTYIGFLGLIFIACLGIYCLQVCLTKVPTLYPSFIAICLCGWCCRGSTLLQKWSNVENPIRPHKNLDLHMEQEATCLESHCKQLVLSIVVPAARSLATKTKIQGIW